MEYKTKRQRHDLLRTQLQQERSSFITRWRDLGDYVLSTRPRFTLTETNRGDRKNQKIIDATASLAARTLRSGMMSGVTSPARPWFRLTTPDPAMSEYQPVKEWLHTVGQRMATEFIRSNLYNTLPIIYGDIGTFGTAAMLIEESATTLFHSTPLPIGSYCIAVNEEGRVDTFQRDLRMTVRQLVKKFGEFDSKGKVTNWDKFSSTVRTAWENHNREMSIDICHIIEPNDDFNPQMIDSKYKRFSSCYFEIGSASGMGGLSDSDRERYLRESGYDYFPVLAPRWEVTGGDTYGTDCPGMLTLGSNKALQTMQKRLAQAVEKMVNPPLVGPTSLQNQKVSLFPGDITYHDAREGQQGLRSIHDVNIRINELQMMIQDTRSEIKRGYFEDLIMMITNDQRAQRATAREIDVKEQERLVAFGPVLEQLNQDLLDPLIDIGFMLMLKRGLLPEPPEEIQGIDLKVDYISVMAQAQKLVSLAGVERFTGFVSNLAAVNPEVMDKVSFDQIVDVYGDMTSVPPSIVKSDEDVEAIRAQRAEAQQAAAKAEQMKMQAGAVKDLSQAETGGDNLLSMLTGATG